MQGIIMRGIGGFYYALDENGETRTVRAQRKIRRTHLKPKVGDRVKMVIDPNEEEGWIQSILPRANELVRPPVANIDIILIVVAATNPEPDLLLVDRLLINARRAGIKTLLVVNKCDLDRPAAEEIARQYANADVSPKLICAETGEGIDELRTALRGKVCALAGQSGAGKSSTINALYGLTLQTGDLSKKIERGKNTTRQCELVPVADRTMILDTPGFSLLETDVFDPVELKDSYPEFMPYEGQCFFQPCYHATEPKCAVRDAVEQGKINLQRHERYKLMLDEVRQLWKERYM